MSATHHYVWRTPIFVFIALFKAVAGNECSLYLAESSVPNGGLGVYAARNFRVGEPIVSHITFDFVMRRLLWLLKGGTLSTIRD
jgi:hypothetical protein